VAYRPPHALYSRGIHRGSCQFFPFEFKPRADPLSFIGLAQLRREYPARRFSPFPSNPAEARTPFLRRLLLFLRSRSLPYPIAAGPILQALSRRTGIIGKRTLSRRHFEVLALPSPTQPGCIHVFHPQENTSRISYQVPNVLDSAYFLFFNSDCRARSAHATVSPVSLFRVPTSQLVDLLPPFQPRLIPALGTTPPRRSILL